MLLLHAVKTAGRWPRARSRRITQLASMILAAVVLAAAPRTHAEVTLRIEIPADGATVRSLDGLAFLAGKALAHTGPLDEFDIVFVVDQSDSTVNSTGSDVDGDGTIERRCAEVSGAVRAFFTDLLDRCRISPDSIFAAELAAVRTLAAQLDPRTTRVGLVSFSGDGDPRTPDAVVDVHLTSDYEAFWSGLRDLEGRRPREWTNLQEAVHVATRELVRGRDLRAPAARRAQQVMLLLTDGSPTLPLRRRVSHHGVLRNRYQPMIRANGRLAIEAAREAAKAGIRIDTYGVGAEGDAEPAAVLDIARVTEGVFTPVARPADLQSVFAHVDFSEVDELRIWNRTTARRADYLFRDADGSFSALLAMSVGENVIEISVRASDGSHGSKVVTVMFEPSAELPQLEPRLLGQRNRLLQARLEDLQSRSLTLQSARDEELRRTLKLQLDEERKRVEERARRIRIEPEN